MFRKKTIGFHVVLHDGLHDGLELHVTRAVMRSLRLIAPDLNPDGTKDVYVWDGTVREDGAYRFRLEKRS